MKKEVKNWLEQAEHDIEVAEYNLKLKEICRMLFIPKTFKFKYMKVNFEFKENTNKIGEV